MFYKIRRLNDAAQKNRKSLVEENSSPDGVIGVGSDEIIPRSQSGISVRSRRSIPSQKSASKNSVDEEQMLIAAELHDLPEGSESGDSETATEVDVRSNFPSFCFVINSKVELIFLSTYTCFFHFIPLRWLKRHQNLKSTQRVATN